MISAIGNSGARSSGPRGFCVPGCSTGGSGFGKSAARLYQTFGMRDSSRTYLIESDMAHSPWWRAPGSGKSKKSQCDLNFRAAKGLLRVEASPGWVNDINQVFTALPREQEIFHHLDLILRHQHRRVADAGKLDQPRMRSALLHLFGG